MILYVCKSCGRWQDVSLAQALQKSFLDSFFANASAEQKAAIMDTMAFDCPAGHGAMAQVQAHERLAVYERLDAKQEKK